MSSSASRSSSDASIPLYPTYWPDKLPPYFNEVSTITRRNCYISKRSNRTRIITHPVWKLRHEEDPWVNRLMRRMGIVEGLHPEILAQIILCKYHFYDEVDPAQLSAFFAGNYGITLYASQIGLISERVGWLRQDMKAEWKSLVTNAEGNFETMCREDQDGLLTAWKVRVEQIPPFGMFRGWESFDPTEAWEEEKASKMLGVTSAEEVLGETPGESSGSVGMGEGKMKSEERDPEEPMQGIEEDKPAQYDVPMKGTVRGKVDVVDMTEEIADIEGLMAGVYDGCHGTGEDDRGASEKAPTLEEELSFKVEEV